MVVLPSLGRALVTTTVFRGWSTSTNCRLVRSWRNASETGARGSSNTFSGCCATSDSKGMMPRLAAAVSSPRCWTDFTRTSKEFRASAMQMPSNRPAPIPSATMVGKVADDGCVGRNAGWTTRTATAGCTPSRRSLELGDQIGEDLTDGVGDIGRAIRRKIRDADIQQDGVELARGGNLSGELVGRLRQAQPPDDVRGHPGTGQQLRVRGDPVLGKLSALECRLGGVRALRRDVHRQLCRVFCRLQVAVSDRGTDTENSPVITTSQCSRSMRPKSCKVTLPYRFLGRGWARFRGCSSGCYTEYIGLVLFDVGSRTTTAHCGPQLACPRGQVVDGLLALSPEAANGRSKELHVIRTQIANLGQQRAEPAVGQCVVNADRMPRGLQKPVDAAHVGQRSGRRHLADERAECRLLPLNSIEVTVGKSAALPDELQCGEAIEVVDALVEPDAVKAGRGEHGDVDTVHRVHQRLEAREVDHSQVIDPNVGELLHRLDEQARTAVGVRRIDLVHAVARDVDPTVTRDRDDRRARTGRVDAREHQDIAATAAHPVATRVGSRRRGAALGIGADEQDGRRRAAGRPGGGIQRCEDLRHPVDLAPELFGHEVLRHRGSTGEPQDSKAATISTWRVRRRRTVTTRRCLGRRGRLSDKTSVEDAGIRLTASGKENLGKGTDNDLDVEPERPVLDVVVVVAGPIRDRGVAP